MTYEQLKEKYYNDEFPLFSDSIKENLNKALNIFFGQSDFDTVQNITGVDVWGAYEEDEIEEGDTDKVSRNEALDEAKKVWDEFTLEEKFNKFIEESDDDTEFVELTKQI